MALLAAAENAQDIASVFNNFLDPVVEHSSEITALISQCFAISSALRELADTISDPQLKGGYSNIREDLQTLLRSLELTFGDVHRLFGSMARLTHMSSSAAYRQVWKDIEVHFQEESRNTLNVRLKYYGKFLDDMINVIYDGFLLDNTMYEDIYDRIAVLLAVQESRLESDMHNLSLGALGPSSSPRNRSFERKRPRRPPPLATDLPPRRRPNKPDFQSPLFDYRSGNLPPVVPEVPNSPTTTASTSTISDPSSSTSASVSHWVAKVFEQHRSTTLFKSQGPISACYGKEMAPGANSRLTEDYDKVVQLPFENGDLVARFYVRSSDQRARIHCRNTRQNNPRKQYCAPLTSLRIEKDKSTLKLCTLSQSRRTKELWACLRFPNYEKLVLVFCTFLAMKAEDTENRARQTDDYELQGETLHYSGKIVDDQFEHALRLLRDRDSGGVRLQASVLRGELKRTPVWTAFVTHQISSRSWMRRASNRIIHLADLQPYIFSSNYRPQLGPGGEHELQFANSTDADEFEDTIKDLK